MNVYFDDGELAYIKEQPKGWLRDVVRRFRDTDNALTAEELSFLKENGGTHGVIRLAQMVKAAEPEVDPETGEVL